MCALYRRARLCLCGCACTTQRAFSTMAEEEKGSWNPKRFDGADYSKFRLRFVLYVKRKKWYTVLEKARPTTGEEAIAAWDAADVAVQSTLVNAVSDRILDEIGHKSTAKEMFQTLDSVYFRKTLMMRVLATRKILSLRMNDGEVAQEFFGRFEKCIGALKDAGEEVSSERKLCYLLVALPERYAHIIDVVDALPKEMQTVDYVKGKLLFDHCKKEDDTEAVTEAAAMKTQVQAKPQRSNGSNGAGNGPANSWYRCHRCDQPGHFRRDCTAELPYEPQYGRSSSGSHGHRGGVAPRFGNWNGGRSGGGSSGARGNFGRRNVATNNTEVNDFDEYGDSDVSSFQVRVVHGKSSKVSSASVEINSIETGNAQDKSPETVTWVLDSGCTDHIVTSDKYFVNMSRLKNPIKVKVADGYMLQSMFIGNIRLFTMVQGRKKEILLRDVYLAPELGNNLISFDRITKAGFSILAQGETAQIQNKAGNIIGVAKKSNKLYELLTYVSSDTVCGNVDVFSSVTDVGIAERWHRMLGHVNFRDLQILCSKQLLDGAPKRLENVPKVCDTCLESKFSNLSHSKTRTRAEGIMDLVHSDVNLVSPKGINGEIGFVTFIDDFSRLARVYCIKSKSEVVDKFMHYVNTMTNLVSRKIKILRCDRGTEYLNAKFDGFCSRKGVNLNPSLPYIHELNGTAERFNRTVMDRARCLRSEAKLDRRY